MPDADQAPGGYWYPAAAGATPTPVAVLEALRRYRAAEQEMRRRARSAMGMGETDLVAVRYLLAAQRTGGAATATDLARHLGISSASTTALVDRLVRSGHAQRTRHPTDRRAIVVRPTGHADDDVRATLGSLHERMLEVAASLDPEQARAVCDLLDRMREVMDDAATP